MAINHRGKIGRWALWTPLVIVPTAFFASLPWLAQQNNDAMTKALAAMCSIFVMGYSVFVAARVTRRLDEVQVAGKRFAQTKGMAIRWFAALMVMMFPPANNVLVDLAYINGPESPDKAVKLGIAIGIMLVVILQALAIFAVATWWRRRIMEPQA